MVWRSRHFGILGWRSPGAPSVSLYIGARSFGVGKNRTEHRRHEGWRLGISWRLFNRLGAVLFVR